MTGIPEESDSIEGRTLTMVRVFEAPRERVFDAWTNADLVSRWWAPPGLRTPRHTVRIAPEIGGEWAATMIDDAGAEFPARSVFTVLDRPHRIELTAAPGSDMPSSLTVTFEEMEGKTIMTVVNRIFTGAADVPSMVEGWAAILDAFRAALLEAAS